MKKLINGLFLIVCVGIVAIFFISPVCHGFLDVSDSYRHGIAINYLYELGIVKGYGDDSYQPHRAINRAEFTKIIIEAKYPEQVTGENCFSDVKNEWFAKYVCFAKEKGIVSGNPDGSFKPEKTINMAEAYKIILETYIDEKIEDSLSDNWYEKYLNYADKNNFDYQIIVRPSREVTRGDMAQIVYLTLNGGDITAYQSKGRGAEDRMLANKYQNKIIEVINEVREKNGLNTLKQSDVLEQTAFFHAVDMWNRNFFDFINPDGEDPAERAKAYYAYKNWTAYEVGENIWEWDEPYENIDLTVNEAMYGDYGWLSDANSQYNILNPEYEEIGVGYYKSPTGKVIIVQTFGMLEMMNDEQEEYEVVDDEDQDGDGIPDKDDIIISRSPKNIVKNYTFKYYSPYHPNDSANGKTVQIILKIPQDRYFYYSNSLGHDFAHDFSNITQFVTYTDPVIEDISNQIWSHVEDYGMNPMILLQQFIEQVVYTDDINTGWDEYPKYPIETLVDQSGDCEDTSFLLAALYKKVAQVDTFLVRFPGHLGIAFAVDNKTLEIITSHWGEDYMLETNHHRGNKDKIVYIETTNKGWFPGLMPYELRGKKYNLIPIK